MRATKQQLELQLRLPTLTEHTLPSGELLFSYATRGRDAVSTWFELRKRVPELGYWPLILGNAEELEKELDFLCKIQVTKPADLFRLAADLDVAKFFEQRLASYGEDQVHGEWPDHPQPQQDFILLRQILNLEEFHPRVSIGFVPVEQPWEALGVACYGGWNECPHPQEHVAIHRYWKDIYGAEIVGMSHDIVEMKAAQCPSTRDEAMTLGREQYLYCADLVNQGMGTLENLAAALMNSDIWYFWWD